MVACSADAQSFELTPLPTAPRVWYGDFKSEDEATRATKQWLRGHKITANVPTTDANGKVSIRIVGTPRQASRAFVIIRRRGLNYWFIQSVSLTVAMQIDGLID